MQTAHRGELREGDHAEYTLLERKMRASRLDGAALFATLEPCAPGARRRPKLSCAERIVLARIKEVWVGIEDPDPTVDRRGIRYLQDNGVAVHMFDLDLQQRIRNANRSFLEQARQRAEEVEETAKRKPMILSALEGALPTADMRDLSADALDRYRATAGIREPLESPAFVRRLLQIGLLRENTENRPTPTGFGYLLFGREPRTAMPQAGVLATIHYADGREEVRDFDGPQVFAPGQVLQWLRDKLPNPIDRSGAQRVEVNERLFTMVREAVVNAIIHRDYAIEGAKCQLTVTQDMTRGDEPGPARGTDHAGALANVQCAHAQPQPYPPLHFLAYGARRGTGPGTQVSTQGRRGCGAAIAAVRMERSLPDTDALPERCRLRRRRRGSGGDGSVECRPGGRVGHRRRTGIDHRPGAHGSPRFQRTQGATHHEGTSGRRPGEPRRRGARHTLRAGSRATRNDVDPPAVRLERYG